MTGPADSHADRCPRCGAAFHCGSVDPGPCACETVRLDAARLAELRGLYTGCLCLSCLTEFAAAAPTPSFDRSSPP
ncbi:MAG: cysteine-rich CWC family protein [Burkholderiales bacterium]|nr:cysteine-rich CWC family protein [Burkholderiales bacterium]